MAGLRILSVLFASLLGATCVHAQCSGVPLSITDGNGYVTTPNYPNLYPDNSQCGWLIGTTDEINYIKFVDFNTEAGYDFVKVYSESVDTPPLGVFTGKSGLNQHFLSGNSYVVTFESDKSTGNRGFNMTYSIVAQPDAIPTNLPDNCGGQFNDLGSGSFYTPNYPNDYDPDLLCEYTVGNYPSSHATQFTFETFDTEPDLDWVQVWENIENQANATANFRLLGEYDGVSGLGVGFASSSYFMIIFSSDDSVQYPGFLANYNTELPPPTSPALTTANGGCGGNMYGSGSFQSPNYPSNYPPNIDCTWRLGNVGQILNVTFYTIQTELCCDYVVVYNCDTKQAIAFYNGNQYINGAQTLLNNCTRVEFHSDDSVSSTGFSAYFEAYDPPSTTPNPFAGCDSSYTSGSGTFHSTNYPLAYPNNMNCRWTFTAATDYIAQIYFTAFSTESGYDIVQILYDGFVYAALSGGEGYQETYSNSLLTVIFHSDYSVAYSGFDATYTFYNPNEVSTTAAPTLSCGYEMYPPPPSGYLESPNFPDNYNNNDHCEWYIGDSVNHFVSLSFGIIQTETCCDHIYIYDMVSGGLVMTYSGSNDGATYFNINPVRVEFFSDYSVVNMGFNMTYLATPESPLTTPAVGCSGYFTLGTGNITSPDYPNFYPNNANCRADFVADPGYYISLEFIVFSLEWGYDWVEIFYNDVQENQITGTQGLGTVYSTTGNMTLIFHSDYIVTYQGFVATYTFSPIPATTTPDPGACGGDLTSYSSGYFTSPGYPSNYYNNEFCQWSIGQTGMGVSLVFSELITEACCDFLYIYDDVSGQLVGTLSGSNPDGFQFANINPVTLIFYTDYSVTAKGFECNFEVVDPATINITTGCGSVYTSGSGYIYSPNYPANYDVDTNCMWQLAGSTPATLVVLDFSTEYGWDWVEVYYSGLVIDVLTGVGDGVGNEYYDMNINIYFHSDIIITDRGFQMQYYF